MGLRVTSLFLNFTAPIFRFIEDILGLGNYFVTESDEHILTEDNLYIEVEDNTL
jgi:hypothetical protein